MESMPSKIDPKALRSAWDQLFRNGTASHTIARHLQVGIKPYLSTFEKYYLGPGNLGVGMSLVLGANGEGKTHLLYCLSDLALRNGHAVAFLEAGKSGLGDSTFEFAKQVMENIETSELQAGDANAARIPALLHAAVQRKTAKLLADNLDPEFLLPRWAEGFRDKNLHPDGLAASLAEGVEAAIAEDTARLRDAAARIAFDGVKLPKLQGEIDGARLLVSIPRMIKLLGFESLVILVDEAETAVERKGVAKLTEFLKSLRFLNDHVAKDEDFPAIVIVGCTDDLWPQKFDVYGALKGRFSDEGKDSLEQRQGISQKFLVRMNKVWVRETFRGDTTDYEQLGAALVDLAALRYPELDSSLQLENVRRFALVASSDRVKKQVKRKFIKAFCQNIELQMVDENQRVIEVKDVEQALDAAVKAILESDSRD